MQHHAGWVEDGNGFVVDGVTVDVVADPAKPRGVNNRAPLYADALRTRPITNPFVSGADGRFAFYTDNPGFAVMADRDGFTDLEVLSGPGPFGTIDVVATADLPAADAELDGTLMIEDAGAGDRNLIVYAGGQRFRIDGGAAF